MRSIEEPFWQQLIDLLELDGAILKKRMDRSTWPEIRGLIDTKIARNTRAHWEQVFDGTNACFAPVLSIDEAADHPHNVNRGVFETVGGVVQPAPAPRYGGSALPVQPTNMTAVDYADVLASWN